MATRLLPIGRILRPHGVQGKLKVHYFGDDLGRFGYQEVVIEGRDGMPKAYEVLEVTPQSPRLILRLKGIEKIEDVEPLVGREISVKTEVLPPPEEGEYYWFDLLGMAVETVEGRRIGKLKEILPTGAHDVFVVEGSRREICLPATKEVIEAVDLQENVMKVRRLEGLWEDEDED